MPLIKFKKPLFTNVEFDGKSEKDLFDHPQIIAVEFSNDKENQVDLIFNDGAIARNIDKSFFEVIWS